MVIDDSKVVVDRLAISLKELPNVDKVYCGYNYENGETLLHQHKIDIAILDINLPGKSGIDLLKMISIDKGKSGIKVIMITEEPTDTKKILCLSIGADYFFDKFEGFEKINEIVSNPDLQAS